MVTSLQIDRPREAGHVASRRTERLPLIVRRDRGQTWLEYAPELYVALGEHLWVVVPSASISSWREFVLDAHLRVKRHIAHRARPADPDAQEARAERAARSLFLLVCSSFDRALVAARMGMSHRNFDRMIKEDIRPAMAEPPVLPEWSDVWEPHREDTALWEGRVR